MDVCSARTATGRPGMADIYWIVSRRDVVSGTLPASETSKRLSTSSRIGIAIPRDWSASCWRVAAIVVTARTSFTTARKQARFFSTRGMRICGQISRSHILIRTGRFSRPSDYLTTGVRIALHVGLRRRRRVHLCFCTFSCMSLAITMTGFTRSIWIRARVRIMPKGSPPVVLGNCIPRMFALLNILVERSKTLPRTRGFNPRALKAGLLSCSLP